MILLVDPDEEIPLVVVPAAARSGEQSQTCCWPRWPIDTLRGGKKQTKKDKPWISPKTKVFLILPDPASVGPVSGHPSCREQRRHGFIKQEVLLIGRKRGEREQKYGEALSMARLIKSRTLLTDIDEPLLLFFGHLCQAVVATGQVSLQARQSGHNHALHLPALRARACRGQTQPTDAATGADATRQHVALVEHP